MRTFYSRHTLPARAAPPLRCFRPALPTAPPLHLGRPPPPPVDARSPCVLAPACAPPQKRFFEGVSALFLSKIPLIIVVPTSLQNIYFYKYILLYNNYLYARKHCTPWRGFSRGWRGVFARALFQGSARAPKRLFVGGLQRAGMAGRVGEDGGRGAETGRETDSSVGRGSPQNDRKGFKMTGRRPQNDRAGRGWQESRTACGQVAGGKNNVREKHAKTGSRSERRRQPGVSPGLHIRKTALGGYLLPTISSNSSTVTGIRRSPMNRHPPLVTSRSSSMRTPPKLRRLSSMS